MPREKENKLPAVCALTEGDYLFPGALAGKDGWLLYADPLEILSAASPDEIPGLLAEVEAHTRAGGHAAGFLSYEAAAGLDKHFAAHPLERFPYGWFALYRGGPIQVEPAFEGIYQDPSWEPVWSCEDFSCAVERVKEFIASGDTYQVNLTYRLRADTPGNPLPYAVSCFQEHCHNTLLHTGSHLVCSLSPETFWKSSGGEITCVPMKGTVTRGTTPEVDKANAEWLAGSEKNRAENVMIVDMVRNDLGRCCHPGSISVEELFSLEAYPDVHQMTSTITGTANRGFESVMRALFPSASITGAPKVRTMEVIRELEPDPRGIYTGAIGWVTPQSAHFSVAIRTLCFDLIKKRAVYGTGAGIVWDSDPADEYHETLAKTKAIRSGLPSFSLLETMLFTEGRFFLAMEHLERLKNAAKHFGFSLDTDEAGLSLDAISGGLVNKNWKVRMLLARSGKLTLDILPLSDEYTMPGLHPPRNPPSWNAVIALNPIQSPLDFLQHKTTYREHYEAFQQAHPDAEEVILFNDNRELTEGTISNLVLKISGKLLTPALSSGLLNGIFRQNLLNLGVIEEQVLTVEDLDRAEAVFFINSVSGWRRADFSW